MKTKSLNRRRFLKGAGVTLSLPWLESFWSSTSHAAPGDTPKRLIVFYGTQGMPHDLWKPSGTPSSYQLGPIMNHGESINGQIYNLADHRADCSIITGMDMTSAIDDAPPNGNAHNLSTGHALCATAMQPGGKADDPTLAGGPSIDNIIADRITPATVAFKTMHLGLRTPWEVSFTGPAQPVNRLTQPQEIANALFGDFTNMTPGQIATRRARQQSVLDATKENIAHLRARISASDRHRLDEYLERVGEIERRLNANIAVGEQCSPIGQLNLQPSPHRDWAPQVDYFHPHYDPDVAAPVILDAMVEALACDRTRVTTFTLGDCDRFHWLTAGMPSQVIDAYATGDWHQDVVHKYWSSDPDGPSPAERQQLGAFLTRVAQWEQGLFAYLLSKLKAKQEGEGSLLDNCLVLYCNEFGSATHKHDDMPYIVAGGCGGAVRTDQWLQANGQPHNRLFLAMMRAFGIEDASFGDPTYCGAGPLTGLLT